MAKLKSTKDNLTKIKGIGPKIQGLLNAKGINTFKDLATAKKTTLNAILVEAGPRFKMHDPSTWMKQAKELAKPTSTPKTTLSKAKPKTTPKPKAKREAKPKASSKSKAKPKTSPKPKAKPTTSESASKIKVGELDSPRFKKIMKDLHNNVDDLTRLTVRKYRKKAKRDAEKMIRDMKKDLRRWTRMLERGELTTRDFEYLVQSHIASAKMSKLEQSGLAIIRLHNFRNALCDIIIDTIFGLVLRGLA